MTHTSRNTTNNTASFDVWRQNTNRLATDVGDVSVLHTELINAVVSAETPSGAVNGTNKTFTLHNTPNLGSEKVYVNSVLLISNTDYTVSNNTIVLTSAPATGASIQIDYKFRHTVVEAINYSYEKIEDQIAAEETRALAAEAGLASDISDVAADLAAEVTNRIADVNAEETRALAAESQLEVELKDFTEKTVRHNIIKAIGMS